MGLVVLLPRCHGPLRGGGGLPWPIRGGCWVDVPLASLQQSAGWREEGGG